ncbi:MAG TPA: FAD:protein FMN transferase [Candidatus Limnocylindria bacterium]|nr:FAD:protein FMN transferase [Candidatus Limnocylindria bacterium]
MAALDALRFEALGGQCELFAAEPADLPRVRRWVQAMHDRLTRFSPDSELSHFNASPGRWVEVSPDLEALLRESLAAHDMSSGLVHVGVLPALLAAGYTRDFAAGQTAPTGEVIVAPPLPEMLEVAPGRARLASGTAIDLGGIAKGWLADRAVERIGSNALANFAGDLRARGAGPDGDGWPVGFGSATVLLVDIGAATSGTGGRRWGERLHHLIDPRTGLPADTDLVEVSVLAPTGAEAEVLAKTALLLGREAGARFLDKRSLGSYLV